MTTNVPGVDEKVLAAVRRYAAEHDSSVSEDLNHDQYYGSVQVRNPFF